MAEAIITSPRSWKPPETFASTQIMMTATFKGDRTLGTSTFGGSVRA